MRCSDLWDDVAYVYHPRVNHEKDGGRIPMCKDMKRGVLFQGRRYVRFVGRKSIVGRKVKRK